MKIVLLIGVTVVVAGCGSARSHHSRLPARFATPWTNGATGIAAASSCREARVAARGLRDQIIAAINAKEIAPRLQEELTARANELAESPDCSSLRKNARQLAAWVEGPAT